MVNSEEFIRRLEKIINYYELSASAFADKITVQRSSISHILTGRNKPSLEFVLKVVKQFPEVNLYWLLNGKGNFPHEESKQVLTNIQKPIAPTSTPTKSRLKKSIEKIIVLYSDGSFDSYNP